MKTRRYRPTRTNLARLASRLRRGGLVAVPTETVYGLAADATDARACRAIFQAKERPARDPLIVHIHDLPQARLLGNWNPLAQQLAEAFWPGPLSLVLPRTDLVPDVVTASQDSVALRMPAHPVFRQLLQLAQIPLAAPSANPFGYVSPTTSQHVYDGLQGRIPAILEGGPCAIGLESTIIDVRPPSGPVLLRPGALPLSRLEEVMGAPLYPRPENSSNLPEVPGSMKRHYCPRTPIQLHRSLPARVGSTEALVFFAPCPAAEEKFPRQYFVLAPDGSGQTAARRLFGLLRDLDDRRFSRIHFQEAPADDVWAEALNDRLTRAAAA